MLKLISIIVDLVISDKLLKIHSYSDVIDEAIKDELTIIKTK